MHELAAHAHGYVTRTVLNMNRTVSKGRGAPIREVIGWGRNMRKARPETRGRISNAPLVVIITFPPIVFLSAGA